MAEVLFDEVPDGGGECAACEGAASDGGACEKRGEGMTCIAWDGKTLAADKRMTTVGLARTVTKIFRVGKTLAGICGDGAQGMEMLAWYRDLVDERWSHPEEKFPAAQRDEKTWVTFVVVRVDGVWVYEKSPYPIRIENWAYATGSGRDYAMAAMHLGRSAKEAVEVACCFDVNCGNGIDTLELAP